MGKITRWKSGLKGAARPERDMTDASFNTSYIIEKKGSKKDTNTGNWRVGHKSLSSITDNLDPLESARYEAGAWKTRADISESIDTDEIEIIDRARGIVYTDSNNTKHRLIRSHATDLGGVVLGNPRSIGEFHTRSSPRWIKPLGFSWTPDVAVGTDSLITTEYTLTLPLTTPGYYDAARSYFNTAGIPTRFIVTTAAGDVTFETQSKYSWDSGETVLTTAPVGQPTEFISDETFYLEQSTLLSYTWQFRTPIELLGVNNYLGSGFYAPRTAFRHSPVEIVDLGPEGTSQDLKDAEFALAAIHDERYAQSLHLSDCEILTDDNKEPILWTSRFDGMDEGDSEWAMVHLLAPVPATLHSRSNELITDDNGIPIVFSN